ncbi:MAG: hypothetical protein LBV67_02605, partial [Streptococcaceae bacterium]|nr:hypothetical protein [Streptococcaceae bacterium]
MREFLNKDDAQKMTTFVYLEKKDGNTATFKELSTRFSFSTYLVKNLLENLQNDLEYFELDQYFQLEIRDKDVALTSNGKLDS